MSNLVPVLLAGGGVAYIAATKMSDAPEVRYPQPQIAPTSGSTISQAQWQTTNPVPKQQPFLLPILQRMADNPPQAAFMPVVDGELQEKLKALEAAAKKAYDDANAVAKAAAAEKLEKELKLQPGALSGATWATIASVAGGAAGAAAGAAIGGPLGAKVGALVGAYLGVKLEEAISKKLPELKKWLKEKWGWVEDKLEDAWGEVEDFFGGLF